MTFFKMANVISQDTTIREFSHYTHNGFYVVIWNAYVHIFNYLYVYINIDRIGNEPYYIEVIFNLTNV